MLFSGHWRMVGTENIFNILETTAHAISRKSNIRISLKIKDSLLDSKCRLRSLLLIVKFYGIKQFIYTSYFMAMKHVGKVTKNYLNQFNISYISCEGYCFGAWMQIHNIFVFKYNMSVSRVSNYTYKYFVLCYRCTSAYKNFNFRGHKMYNPVVLSCLIM